MEWYLQYFKTQMIWAVTNQNRCQPQAIGIDRTLTFLVRVRENSVKCHLSYNNDENNFQGDDGDDWASSYQTILMLQITTEDMSFYV